MNLTVALYYCNNFYKTDIDYLSEIKIYYIYSLHLICSLNKLANVRVEKN